LRRYYDRRKKMRLEYRSGGVDVDLYVIGSTQLFKQFRVVVGKRWQKTS
jgi:hypothetical protein